MCVCVRSAGTLSVSSTLSELRASTVRLTVSAHDGVGVASLKPADIIINILNVDHAPALFQKSLYSFSVSEGSPRGTSVGEVQVVKPHGEFPFPAFTPHSFHTKIGRFSVIAAKKRQSSGIVINF